jgi:hypothetical protein
MRFLALLVALVGAGGAGVLGYKWQAEQKRSDEVVPADRPANPQLDAAQLAHREYVMRGVYGLFAAVPLGVIGGILAMMRKGKLAALVLLVAYGVPLGLLAFGSGPPEVDARGNRMEIVKVAAMFAGGLPLAVLLSLFVPPPRRPKKRRARPGITLDDDIVG